jgi:hypothetical protein
VFSVGLSCTGGVSSFVAFQTPIASRASEHNKIREPASDTRSSSDGPLVSFNPLSVGLQRPYLLLVFKPL